MLKSLVRLVVVALVGSWLLGLIGALMAKRRIVPSSEPDADEVVLAAIFAPLQYRSTARSFRGGSIECWYGGGVVDLRDATLDPGGARLTVRAIFGGGQILVPPTWPVVTAVLGIGGVTDTRSALPSTNDEPCLTIDGLVAFGGFAVASAENGWNRDEAWPRAGAVDSGW
jgi:hypothetical protein